MSTSLGKLSSSRMLLPLFRLSTRLPSTHAIAEDDDDDALGRAVVGISKSPLSAAPDLIWASSSEGISRQHALACVDPAIVKVAAAWPAPARISLQGKTWPVLKITASGLL